MLGFLSCSRSGISPRFRVVCAAVAALMLSPPVAAAAERHHRAPGMGVTHERPWPPARAEFGAEPSDTFGGSNTTCIGGYRYMRHIEDANRTAAEDLVPLPCR